MYGDLGHHCLIKNLRDVKVRWYDTYDEVVVGAKNVSRRQAISAMYA
jgi:hypothetical protein